MIDVRILVVGAGGLGSPAALALAESGVRTLGICDPDVVDASNLHRQLLHSDADVGRRKVDSAKDAIARVAPACEVVRLPRPFCADMLPHFDIIVEGSDSPETKFAVSDACVHARKPCVIGGAIRWSGQVFPWRAPSGPGDDAGCYRCLFEAPPPPESVPTCSEAGIVGPVCGVIGALQAAAALVLAGWADARHAPQPGRIYTYDGLAGRMRDVPVRRRPDCLCQQQQEAS
jgi:molybdopterin/thiamine biosynthesis adenylyltransferase